MSRAPAGCAAGRGGGSIGRSSSCSLLRCPPLPSTSSALQAGLPCSGCLLAQVSRGCSGCLLAQVGRETPRMALQGPSSNPCAASCQLPARLLLLSLAVLPISKFQSLKSLLLVSKLHLHAHWLPLLRLLLPCAGEGVVAAFASIAQEVLNSRWQRHRWQHPQHPQPQPQQSARVGRSTPRRSATAAPAAGASLPAGTAGTAGSAAPLLAMSSQRPRSADSRVLRQQQLLRYGEAVAGSVAEAGEGASRGRARSVSPSPPAGEGQREYVVGGSQLGRVRAPEEQSCRIA